MIRATPFQHHYEALNMILNDPKYHPIFEVDRNRFMNKIFEGNHYYLGKDSRSILDSKGHDYVLKTSPLH